MTGRVRRVLAACAVAGLASMCAPPTARAADCGGVTVVVDFRSLGGGVRTGCAPGDPASGTAALTAAGFGYTFASRQPGFVCRINGEPSSDPCVTTSPTTAYWGYWHGRPGGSWVYSSTSASAYDPAPGSVEGWSFGAGEQPGIAPPAPAPQPTRPAPQPPAPGQPAPGQPAPGQPARGQPAPTRPASGHPAPPAPGDPTQPTSRPSGTPASTTSGTTTEPRSSATTAGRGTSGSAAPTSSVAVEPTAGTSSSGGTVGLVVGIVVIAALAGLGLWTARRRARATE
ncbi:hypothetical protein FHX81_0232 [Saccharothrix saharensis]|uniref:LPXTG-motif cell wall-anchored protein n=1 Tax=Saccharothrix saharensis TaxID=571190 RepID=A0A543J570_9PSEU|nr:hypothetical protein [Saccharothrix saharensis]TQM77983.1 hypothetical protein FHX81_0232 [Saccharothrix saharensis]